MIRTYSIATKALAAAGTSTTSEPVSGVLVGAYVGFNAATLTRASQAGPAQTILTLTTAGTQWYYPRVNVHNVSGGTLSYADGRAQVEPFVLSGDYVDASLNGAGTIAAITLVVQQ